MGVNRFLRPREIWYHCPRYQIFQKRWTAYGKREKHTGRLSALFTITVWRSTFISSKKLLGAMLTTLDVVISQRPTKEKSSDSLLSTIKRSGCFFLCIYGITRYISGGE